ncbi:ATP-binding protein [Kibdelosporangium lantanae]|uniref:ATP-binding protein n=1 Tax=Kibdelosporangium lantanae TaxID=1497396 RepID=A0ABW3M4H9_9PSEU
MGNAVHRTILVVDVASFATRTNPRQVVVREGMYAAVREALEAAQATSCLLEDRGDGVFVLAPPSVPKSVFVDVVPYALVAALRQHNAARPEVERIRLRMALHAGEVTYDDHGATSASINLTFRLLDAAPLKAALAESSGVLAVITSAWFYEDVVRHSTDAAAYRQVQVDIKETSTTAWIYLPDHQSPITAARVEQVPRQLPLAVRDFTGRAEHLAALDSLLPDTEAVVISALDGTAGVGKTTLAVHWAHRVQHRFPDGTLHVNLRGYGPGEPATPAEALDGFLRALGTPPEMIPKTVDAQAAQYRTMLAGRRVLIVLDNANSAEQVRPLLPGSPGCLVLVTSRASLTGLVVNEAAGRIALDLMTREEALDLVTKVVGERRVEAEPDAIDELIRMCARLPLALRIAASWVATRPDLTVVDVLDDLNLDTLGMNADETTAIRGVFDWSYQRLPEDQARMFRRLGLNPGPETSLHAATAVAETDIATARRLLDCLARAHMIQVITKDRYRLHDLLRAYATELATNCDTAGDRKQASHALLSWYAHQANAAHECMYPHLRPLQPRPRTSDGDPVISFMTSAEAIAWHETESANVTAAFDLACRSKLHQQVVVLAKATKEILDRRGQVSQLVKVNVSLRDAARACGDRQAEIGALEGLSYAFQQKGLWSEAYESLKEAFAVAVEGADSRRQAGVLNDQGVLFIRQRRYAEAIGVLSRALPLSSDDQRGRLAGVIESNLSDAWTGLGEYERAIQHAERSMHMRAQSGDPAGEAYPLLCIARAHQGMGSHQTAIRLCEQVLAMTEALQLFPWLHAEVLEAGDIAAPPQRPQRSEPLARGAGDLSPTRRLPGR